MTGVRIIPKRLRYDEMVRIEEWGYRAFSFSKIPSFRVDDFLEVLLRFLEKTESERLKSFNSEAFQNWISGGVECQVMKVGGTEWQSGKVRFTLGFYSEEELIDNKKRETWEILAYNDAVRIKDKGLRILYDAPTFRIGDWMKVLVDNSVKSQKSPAPSMVCYYDAWVEDGVPCLALRLGVNQWEKGKVRLGLEFCSDEEPGELSSPEPRDRVGAVKVEVDETPGEVLDRAIDGVLSKIDEKEQTIAATGAPGKVSEEE